MDSSVSRRPLPVTEQQSLANHIVVDSPRQTSRRLDAHTAADHRHPQNQMACVDPQWAQTHHLGNFMFSPSFDLYQTSPVHMTRADYGVEGANSFEYPAHTGPLNAHPDSSLATLGHGDGYKAGRQQHRGGQTGDSVSVSPKSIPTVMTINHTPKDSQGQASPWNHGPVSGLDGEGTPLHDHPAPLPAADEEQKPPAWSLLKTKAGKQRRRLPLACFACRQKKVRCSGEQPTCKHCHRWRISCVYKTRTRKATAARKGSKELQDSKHVESGTAEENPSDLLLSAKSTVASSSRRTSTSTKGTRQGKRSIEEAFGGDQEPQAEESPIHEIPREPPSVTPQHQRFDLKDSVSSEESDRALSTSIQGHLSGPSFDFMNGAPYSVLHQPDMSRRSSSNVQPVLLLAVCALPGPSQGQAGARTRQHSETLEGAQAASFSAETFDGTNGGRTLNHYFHPPMVLPQHVSFSSGPPTTLQEQEEQPQDLYREEDRHASNAGQTLGQMFHPPMILPQQMYHSDFYSHDAQGTADSGLGSYHSESLDTSRAHATFGTDIHPPMVLPQHLISPSVFPQEEKGHVPQTPLSQVVYPNHMTLRSAHTPPDYLSHQDNEYSYTSFQGMNLYNATSAAPPTSDGNRFVWPMNYPTMSNENLDHSTIPTWSASLHGAQAGMRDITTSREGPTPGFLRSASPGRDEANYR